MSCRNSLRASVLCTMLLLFSHLSFSQDRTISGKVTDSKDGSAIAAVSVVAKGTNNATQTKPDGSFTISVPNNVSVLIFSSIGFTTQEVSIAGQSNLDVSLVVNNAALGEIVVVAYGTRRKGDLTGAVTSVTSKDFQKGNINSAEQLLQGKVAGLNITTGGGSAGGGSRIRIRGGASLNSSNDPLIVIDGVPVEGNGIAGSANLLNTINPNDIESISVLKDASATSLYGARASNGVIIVTTKKGVKGKLRFNYNTNFSVGVIGKKTEVLSANEIRDIVNANGTDEFKNMLGTANTNWQDEVFQSAIGFDNTISASGSIANLPFRASVGYLNQDGTLKTNNFKRLTGSLNLTPKFFKDYLSVSIAVKGSNTKNRFANEGAIGSAINFDPTQPIMSGNKNWGGYYEWLQADGNPIDLATRNPLGLLYQRDNRATINRLIGNVQLDYKLHFFPDLHILANLGMDNISSDGNDNTDSSAATNYKTRGRFVHYEQKKKSKLADVSLFYSKEIKGIRSKIDVLVGHTYQTFLTEVSNFAQFGQDGVIIPGTVPTFTSDRPEYRLEAYIGRLNFSHADKYLLTASLRRDASSKFSKENRIGYFPSVAAAWRMREDLFQSVRSMSELKLRASWGKTGQQDGIGYYNYRPRYSLSNETAQYQFGDAFVSYLRPEGYDPDLQWESTETINVGLDFGFISNRITGSIDFYKRKTSDLLAEVTVAPGANFVNKITTNVGNTESEGVEVTLNTIPVKGPNLTWELGMNYTYNKGEITNLQKNPDPNFTGFEVSRLGGGTGNNIGKLAVGYAPYAYNVYKQVYNTDGTPIEGLYEDLNRDGVVDADDRYLYKKPAADVLVGFNTQVTYKQFSAGLAGHGAFGNYLYNDYFSGSAVLRNVLNPIKHIGNASSNYLETKFQNNQYFSDYYVVNASFFRLDNINLGYNVGRVLNNKASLRAMLSIQNVFVITKYQGLDPENAGDGGVDGNIYPRPRIYSLGLNLDF